MTAKTKTAPAVTKVGSYRVALEKKPHGGAKKAIHDGLEAHNIAAAGSYKYSDYIIGVRDAKGAVRGGFLVEVYYETAFLKWAWVDPKLQRKSLGRALMAAAEDEARKRGAKNLWLDTFSFQARPFYEKLGYTVFGTLKMGRPGVERYFLSKELLRMNDTFWMRFFAFAGIFNLIVGIALLLSPSLITHIFPLPLPGADWLFPRVFGACVFAFGVGYLIVASDLDRNRGLIHVGVIGKSLFFLVLLIYWIKGTIGFWGFTGGVLDFAFALFFLRFLTRYPAR